MRLPAGVAFLCFIEASVLIIIVCEQRHVEVLYPSPRVYPRTMHNTAPHRLITFFEPASARFSRHASFFSFFASAFFGSAFALFSCLSFFFSESVSLSFGFASGMMQQTPSETKSQTNTKEPQIVRTQLLE